MDSLTKQNVKNHIKNKLIEKINSYEVSSGYNPFLNNIIPSNYVNLHSFIHSIATTLGISIYVQISKIIAESNDFTNCTKLNLYDSTTLSEAQINKIEEIIDQLNDPNNESIYESETEEILQIGDSGGRRHKGDTNVKLSIEKGNLQYLILIKSAKPNLGELRSIKRKLLKWRARLNQENIRTILAYPFNPFYPDEYRHFASKKYFEKGKELLIGAEYWDFIGGRNTYDGLVEIFEEVGEELSSLINEKINEIISI
ncbi:MAG: TdeIII family type II restriction endonuclease [Candidatus Lokiarchaeia archaeon]